jgi:hypothetical protein
MNDSEKELWFAEPVLGSLPPDIAAEKLSALGEPELAEVLRTAPREAEFRGSGGWRWPFRTKAWQHTSHAFGYIAPLKVAAGIRDVVDVGAIEADISLKKTRVKITLDALRIEEYPGSGTHHILFDFYAQNQIRPAPEHLHFNATYRVRQGEQAAIRGYPIFLGLTTGNDGLAFRCYTVNVKNEGDQALLAFLDSDTLKAGLRLATTVQPAIAPLTDLAHNITKGIAGRNRNVAVQDVYLGLDFSDTATGAKLRLGSYVVVQVPEDQVKFTWKDWVFETESRAIVRRDNPQEKLPYNFFIFAVAKYEGA